MLAAHADTMNRRDENLIIGGIVHSVSTLSDTAIGNSRLHRRHRRVAHRAHNSSGVRVWINFEGKPVEDVLGRIQEQFIQKVLASHLLGRQFTTMHHPHCETASRSTFSLLLAPDR